jgi:hypothetical protein
VSFPSELLIHPVPQYLNFLADFQFVADHLALHAFHMLYVSPGGTVHDLGFSWFWRQPIGCGV